MIFIVFSFNNKFLSDTDTFSALMFETELYGNI